MITAPQSFWTLFNQLMAYVKPYRWAFLLACCGNLIYALVDSIFVRYFSKLVDNGLVARNEAFICWIPVTIVIYFLTRGLGAYVATYFMGFVGRSVVRDFRVKILKWLLLMPASYYHENNASSLISKINYDTEQIAETISNAIMTTIRGGLLSLGLISVMFFTNWRLTLLLLATVPILALYIHHVSKKMRQHSTNIQSTMAEITHIAKEITTGFPVIRTFDGYRYERQRIQKVTTSNFSFELKMVKTVAISVPFMQLIGAFAISLLLYLATLPPEHPLGTGMTAGEFSAMLYAMLQLMRPIKQLTLVNSVMQRGIAAADSILSLLSMPTEKDNGTEEISQATGHVCFEQASFRYNTGQPWVVKNINLTVHPGQMVAFVGASGSGKTTLLSLLPRLYDLTTGYIRLDGIPIEQFTLKSLRAQFAVVSQQVILFNDTVLNNIAYGAQDQFTFEQIQQAAQLAHADEFIQDLSLGYETMVGDNGVKLSGGQRQRIAIARAFLKNAPILILDEATASLDSTSEQKIELAMTQLLTNRTTFVIAHRLSTIQRADLIVVMEDGKIIEAGSHSDLLELQGKYKQLWQAQSISTESLDMLA